MLKARPKPRRYREYDYEFRTRSRVTEASLAAEYEAHFEEVWTPPPDPVPEWYEIAPYAAMVAVADFNRDRYALPTSLTPVEGAYTKQSATFAEWLSVTAASTTTRTRWNESQKLVADLATNAARFTYENGRRQLVQRAAAATNVLTYSQAFSNAVWTKDTAGAVYSHNVTGAIQYAPDETQTATKIAKTANTTPAGLYLTTGVAVGSGVRVDDSVFVKYDGRNTVAFSVYSEQSGDATKVRENIFFFDFTTGVITGDAVTGTDGEISQGSPAWTRTRHTRAATYVGQGWWRIHWASTSASATTHWMTVYPCGTNGRFDGAGNSVLGTLVWGRDTRLGGTELTEYIPTSGGTGTVQAETITPSAAVQTILGTSDPTPAGLHDMLTITYSGGVYTLNSPARATPDLIVFDGDSYFGGYRVETQSFPIQTTALLDHDVRPIDMFNNGYTNGGLYSTQHDATYFTTHINIPFGSRTATNKILVMQPMTADVTGGGNSIALMISRAQTFVNAAVAAGWTVFVVTEPIWQMPNYDYLLATAADRLTYNTGLRNLTGTAGVVDVGAHAIMGDAAYLTNGTYFQQDDPSGIPHPTATGYAIWAALAVPLIEAER